MLRATAIFGGVSAVLIALAAWGLTFFWPDAAGRGAVLVSAGIALVVQFFAFAAARLSAPSNVMAGWGVGVLLRFVVLVAYAFLALKALGLPLAPALLSLVTFFFVTSLVEPVLLKT